MLVLQQNEGNGYILCGNCVLKPFIEGGRRRIEVRGRRGRRRKQLLDGLKEKNIYWNLKREAISRNLRTTRFGR